MGGCYKETCNLFQILIVSSISILSQFGGDPHVSITTNDHGSTAR